MAQDHETGRSRMDWWANMALRMVIRSMLILPYQLRVPAMGWISRRIIAPIAGYHQRSITNLNYIYPDLEPERCRKIADGVADNMGRTFIENYSPKPFMAKASQAQITGAGLAALEQARASGQPVILVSGHFGNYEAPRAALVSRGFDVGGLFRPARNKYFNDHYAQTMLAYGGPIFEQGHRGTAGFVRHLKSGGFLVLLFDQNVVRGTRLPFLGKPAATALSAAQLALRYKALLVPFYGVRQENGLDFDLEIDAPIPPTDPETMTRQMNASLERRIEAHPEQWFWIHRRWKEGYWKD